MNALGGLRSATLALGLASSTVPAHAADTTAKRHNSEVHGIFNLLAEAAKKQERGEEIAFPPGDVDKVYVLLGREPSDEEMNYLADSWAEIKRKNPLLELDGKNDENIQRINEGIHNKREREYLAIIDELKPKK